VQGPQDHRDRRGNRHSTARERSFREEFPQVSDDIDEYTETCKDDAGVDALQFYNVFGDVIEPQFLQPLLDDAFYARETLADFWRWFEETLRTGDEYVQRGLRGVRLSGSVISQHGWLGVGRSWEQRHWRSEPRSKGTGS